jgi:glycosyltransferase involved in cell wall biosynthesis
VRILYDHQVFSWQKYGGISRYFYEIITRLAKQNKHEIDLFQGFNINKYGLEKYKDQYSQYFNHEKKNIPKTGFVYKLANEYCLKYMAHNKHYNIYHPTYYDLYFENNKFNTVVTVYDMIHELYNDEFKNDDTSKKKKKLINRAHGIIAISQSTKKDLIGLFNVPENKIKVIYLANSLFEPIESEAVFKPSYMLYVGSRNKYKNFIGLVKAFSNSIYKNDFSLVCFGGGSFNQEEKQLLNNLNISNKVYHYDGSDQVLSNLYYYADLFIYPSKYEGFGIPPLEAMHYGTPVLVSDVSSIPEVVGDAGIYFAPNDVEDLTNKIDLILSDNKLRLNLREKGFLQEQKFSWDRCAKETLNFYKELY